MAINIDALINCMGKTYQEIFDMGLIPYKTKPTGFSGDSEISLDMVKEGIFLSFYRNNRALNSMTLRILDEKNPDFKFPNELPSPLVQNMYRSWIHEQLGNPEKSLPPRKRLKKDIGWTELYTLLDFSIPTSMQVDYDLFEKVKRITFLPTSEVRW